MADAHNFFVVGPTADFKFRGQSALLDNEAVVARGGEGVGHAGVDRFAVVVDLVGFAVHEAFGANDFGAGDEADALVAEADAENGEIGAELSDDVVGDTALFGRAGAGADDDVGGLERFDFVGGDFVVAEDLDFQARGDFAEPLDEVVGEGVGSYR